MQQKKVIVVATGGTIAMKYDEASQGLIPACSGEDLAAAVPGIDKLAQLEFCQFSNIASPGMTPDDMWRLHLKCEEFLAREDVTGVVVTHGTDTLEETSYSTLRRSAKSPSLRPPPCAAQATPVLTVPGTYTAPSRLPPQKKPSAWASLSASMKRSMLRAK